MKTKNGLLNKTSEQYVNRLLHGAHASFDCQPTLMRPWALALWYCLRKKLIFTREEQYVAEHRLMCNWISRSVQDLYADIIDFVFSYQRLWRKDMVLEMVAVPHNPWLSCRAFGDELKNRIFANIKILAYYGLVEYQKSSGDLLFRGSRENAREREGAMKNRQAADVVILPDFSAMFPQETSPEYLYWFSKVGSLDSLDKVYKGKIIKDIILDSLAAGIEGRSILAFLTLWRSSGNVIETVKEWIREFSQVCMETGAIVASADEKVTRRLYSFSPLAACLRPIQAHCIFRVVKGQEETVANLLSEMGFDHRSPMMQNSKNASENRTEPDIPVDCAAGETMLSPVFDFEKSAQAPPLLLQQGKYSGSLKALELTELMHVIDYSLLMGSRLRIEYGGSPGIRKGIYLIRPLRYQKGPDPFLEAESGRTCIKKIFLLGRILKIGVEPLYDENK
jgi:hypothetical protein